MYSIFIFQFSSVIPAVPTKRGPCRQRGRRGVRYLEKAKQAELRKRDCTMRRTAFDFMGVPLMIFRT